MLPCTAEYFEELWLAELGKSGEDNGVLWKPLQRSSRRFAEKPITRQYTGKTRLHRGFHEGAVCEFAPALRLRRLRLHAEAGEGIS